MTLILFLRPRPLYLHSPILFLRLANSICVVHGKVIARWCITRTQIIDASKVE
jgi:hypothetical protein